MPRHHGIAAGVSILYQIDEDAVSIALRNLPTEVRTKEDQKNEADVI